MRANWGDTEAIAVAALAVAITLNAVAQLFLKMAAQSIAAYDIVEKLGNGLLWDAAWKTLTNLFLWAGGGCYVVSIVMWIYVLSKIPLSVAYPMQGVGYGLGVFLAWLILHEDISVLKIMGVLVIVSGVWMVSKG